MKGGETLEVSFDKAGDKFTAVDLFIASQLRFGILMTKSVEARPAFNSYLERILGRQAFKRVEAQSAEYVAKLKATGTW